MGAEKEKAVPAGQKRLAADGFAWVMNVSTSVLIVFVNKVLMDRKSGYKFCFGESLLVARALPPLCLLVAAALAAHFTANTTRPRPHNTTLQPTTATTLCAFHFIACAVSVRTAQWLGFTQRARLPWRGARCVELFSFVCCVLRRRCVRHCLRARGGAAAVLRRR